MEKRTYHDIFVELGIEKYEQRILSSSSTGELSHLRDYVFFVEEARKRPMFAKHFPACLDNLVAWAEENWKRPESIFQHVRRALAEGSRR